MFEVTNRSTAPYASVCYIQCEWADGTATRASGVVVGENDVLTALHAVYDPQIAAKMGDARLGWAQKVFIYPGADTSPFSTPFGEYTNVGSMVGRAATWDLDGDGLLTQQESAGDLALIGLKSRIGDVTGWLPTASYATDFTGIMAGYPARGSGLMAESVFADATLDWGLYDIRSGLGPGASGGPLLATVNGVTSVVGVLSSGNAKETLSTYAGLYGTGTYAWLQQAMAANDTLLGLPPGSAPLTSPTLFTGSSSADTFVGTAGNDIFKGLGGNDTFEGTWGIDTAVYTGVRSSYVVSQLGSNVLRVSDTISQRDGIDTMWNVERLRFDDSALAFDYVGHAGQAYRLYIAAFNRAPDLSGLGFQISALDSGFALVQIANGFLASNEFSTKYGSLDNTNYVTQLYLNVLHRQPEQSGLDYHLNDLSHGATRAQILTNFSESPECQLLLMGQAENGIAYIPA